MLDGGPGEPGPPRLRRWPIASLEWPERVEVVDSHTEGEPTRVVIEGWPPLDGATMAARRDDLLRRHDRLRQAVVCEPRGHEAMVGGLLTPPVDPESAAGVIFFNNTGALGMCGHGLIGVVRTLEHLGRLAPGTVRLDTPVGTVGAELHDDGSVTLENVPSFCHARDVEVEVPGVGPVRGDVAWGGNWFFLAELPEPALDLENLPSLIDVTTRILRALRDHERDWRRRGGDRPRRAVRPARAIRAPTPATSSSAPASPGTAPPAAPAPRPRWRFSPPEER